MIWRNHSNESIYGYNLTIGGDGGTKVKRLSTKMKMQYHARRRGILSSRKYLQKRHETRVKTWERNIKLKPNIKIKNITARPIITDSKKYNRFREHSELNKADYFQWQWDENKWYPSSPRTNFETNRSILKYIEGGLID